MGLGLATLILVAVWALASMKTSRPDGVLLRTHPYRRMMFHIMPSRSESVVLFETAVKVEALEAWLAAANQRFHVDMTHALVAACNVALGANPRMNRFVAGKRLYQRDGRFITFSMKRKKLDRGAKLATVKLPMKDGETVRELCLRLQADIEVERSDTRTYADKEFDLFNLLPRPVLYGASRVLRLLDDFNLLPGSFIANDGLYTSIFLANLGSVGLGGAYHHLYEWGNCPLFLVAGRVEERVLVEQGQPVVRRVLPLRFTYDERVEDGLNAGFAIADLVRVLEDPARYLGCLVEDGSDAVPMAPHPEIRAAEA